MILFGQNSRAEKSPPADRFQIRENKKSEHKRPAPHLTFRSRSVARFLKNSSEPTTEPPPALEDPRWPLACQIFLHRKNPESE